tara:strand:- start:32 stop:250 length:219 start_codon:yes stop_codon:yes gene_type:complete
MNKERQQELIEKMKYITVLDFEVGKVFQYETPIVLNELVTQHEDYEHYLTEKGHNLNNCEWMVHDSSEIITN